MRKFLATLVRDHSGTTAIEYGLILVLIVVAIIGSVSGLSDENDGLWATVSSKTTAAIS